MGHKSNSNNLNDGIPPLKKRQKLITKSPEKGSMGRPFSDGKKNLSNFNFMLYLELFIKKET
jgi:hypothetical protein